MNEKIDFPFPPKHYKEITKGNYVIAPNVPKLFEQNSDIYVFGQKESLHDLSVKALPNYVEECKHRFYNNEGLRAEMLKLVEQLKATMLEYFMAIGHNSENLAELNVKINDIACHMFYLLKLAKNTLGAQKELGRIYRESIVQLNETMGKYRATVDETKEAFSKIC
jgi:hypothetical protein